MSVSGTSSGGGALSVLLVEDSELDAGLVVRELDRAGHALHWMRVDNAADLQAALSSQSWDIVLSDFSMPRFTGFDALDVVKAHDVDLPFILISGTIGEELAVRAIHAGASDYLLKDRLVRLSPAIGRALRESNERRARKRAEQERNTLAQQRQLALDAAHMGWWHYDPATRMASWDDRYKEIFGVSGYECPNDEILARLHPEDLPRVWAAVEAALDPSDPKPYSSEYRVNFPDGSMRWVEAHGVATFDGKGAEARATSLVGTVLDITERKRSEEALRESEEQYRRLFDEATEGIGLADAESGEILDCNRAFEQLTGFSRDELIGKNQALLHPSREPNAGSSETFERHRTDRRGDTLPTELLTKSGELKHVEIKANVIQIGGKSVVQAFFRDVTEEQRHHHERETTVKLLHLLNAQSDVRGLVKGLTSLLHEWTGCEAVGVRLRDGDDFPYYETRGLTAEFIEAERSLCTRDCNGELLRDSEGRPTLACSCGDVLNGRYRPEWPFCTERGTFWTNSISDLKSEYPQAIHRPQARNRCVSEGFESVALIPLRTGGQTVGLLQLDDRAKGRFTPDLLNFLENAADQFAIALAQRQAQRASQESEAHYRSLFANMINGFSYCKMLFDDEGHAKDFVYLEVNAAFEAQTGLKDVAGKKVSEVIPGIRERDPELLEVYGRVATTGVPERFDRFVASLHMWFSVSAYCPEKGYFVAVFDVITERKRSEEEMRRLNRALRILSECNETLIRATDEKDLLNRVCSTIVEIGGYGLAWAGFSEDSDAKAVRPMAWYADTPGYIEKIRVRWDGTALGRGPAGRSIRSGEPVFTRDTQSDPDFAPWREAAASYGYLSVISLPLRSPERVFGALLIYACQANAFDEAEVRLLMEMADDLAYGILTLRTRAERDHARTELEALARFTDENPSPVLRIAESGVLLYANCSAAPLLSHVKLAVGQLVPAPWREWLSEAFAARANREVELNLQEGCYSLILAPITESGYANVYGRDITPRKRALEKLRESEGRYRALVDSAPDAIVVYRDGEVLYANSVAVELCGLSSFEELRKKGLLDVIHPDERAGVAERIRQGMLGAFLPLRETRLMRPDGTEVHIETVGRSVDYEGAPAVQVFVRDITQRKRAEEELRKLSMAVNQSPTSVVITDLQGNIEYVNPKFTESTGYTFEEVRGQNPRVLTSGAMPPDGYERLWKTILAGGEWRGEFHNKKKDGTLFWERAYISPVRDASGRTTHFLAIEEDITQQRSIEEQYRQAQKMEAVGQLAGGVAHDFNNILQAMVGYSSMLLDSLPEGDETREFAEEIAKGADRAAGLTRQLLAFSRRQILEMEDLELNDVVQGLMKMIRRIIGEDVEVRILEGRRLGTVHADRGQMEQVLLNLCVNARDAMPQGGVLAIETENVVMDDAYCGAHAWASPGRYVLLSVTDSGVGMDASTRSRIFEPFFTTKESGKGTGLGLATVYGIVQQHQGMLQVYSEVGKGSTFKVYLPSVERSAAAVGPKLLSRARGGTETILVAEDDETLRKLAVRILEEAGYTVLLAADGEEAFSLFQQSEKHIDLLLLDLVMPKMGGKALHDVLRKECPRLRFLLTSGYSTNVFDADFALSAGIELIQKPYSPDALLRKVRHALDEVPGEGSRT